MSTNDVPGANAANRDILAAGCWAEHTDGSLIYVLGNEGGRAIYQIYDVAQTPPVFYQDAMIEKAFKDQFSFPPVGASADKWTWHDKTPFPWNKVMQSIQRPTPQHADVSDTLSAAARVAESLKLRAENLTEEKIGHNIDTLKAFGREIMGVIEKALGGKK